MAATPTSSPEPPQNPSAKKDESIDFEMLRKSIAENIAQMGSSLKDELKGDLSKMGSSLKEEFNNNFSRLKRILQRLDNDQRNLLAFSPLFNSDNRRERDPNDDALTKREENMVPVPRYW